MGWVLGLLFWSEIEDPKGRGAGHVRQRQRTEICNFGAPSPLDFWIQRKFGAENSAIFSHVTEFPCFLDREKSEGKKYTPLLFSARKTQVPQQAKKRLGVYQKACFQGKKKENTYTPKRLQGVCGGPLRGALVYRFWPPKKKKLEACDRGSLSWAQR